MLKQFEVGFTYTGWGPGDTSPRLTIASRIGRRIRTTCGRTLTPVLGLGMNGDTEVLRLDEDGPVARGGVFRADCAGGAA